MNRCGGKGRHHRNVMYQEKGEIMAKRTVTHVVPNKGKGWDIKKEGVKTPIDRTSTKDKAVQEARKMAKSEALGQLKIHKQDGTIQTEHTYRKDPYPPKG